MLTDNGSNMIAAFKDLTSSLLDMEDELDDELTNAGVIADSGHSSSSFQSPTTSDSEESKSGDKDDLTLAKFNKSCKGTEKLIQLSGKKPIANCPTRWSSTFLVVSRLLKLRPHFGGM